MDAHIRIVGILNAGVGAVTGLAALFLILFHWAHSVAAALSLSAGVFYVVLIWALLLAPPCVITGIALVNFRPWARTVGTVLSVLQMINVPLGTALGVYGLWVLLSDETDMFFEPRFGECVRHNIKT